MDLTREQIDHYLNLFKACGKRIRFEPIDAQWYNGKRFALTSFNRGTDSVDRHKFYNELREACRGKSKVFDASIRRDYNYGGCAFNIYTNDDGLLQFVLQHPQSSITHVRYTSEQYDAEVAKLNGVPFDIQIKRSVDPKRLFKCYIGTSAGPDGLDSLKNLGEYIQDNPEHFTIDKYLLARMINSSQLWANDYHFYCDDFDTLSLAILAGAGGIRKIYKNVKKEEQQ
jgi:hypothetical protein